MQKTSETKENYIQKAEGILKKYKNDFRLFDYEPEHIADWLIEQKADWSKNTWRKYRACLVYFFETQNMPDLAKEIKHIDYENCTIETYNTSALKRKYITQKELAEFKKFLKYKTENFTINNYYKLIYFWFLGILNTGIRPNEWQGVINENGILKVPNAKNTNGRSFGKYRHIDIQNAGEEINSIIAYLLNKLSGLDKKIFNSTYRSAVHYIACVSRDLWPAKKRKVSLYTARHQFVANLKKQGFDRKTLGALLGHNNTYTASRYYALQNKGFPDIDIKIKALEEDIQKVEYRIPSIMRNKAWERS